MMNYYNDNNKFCIKWLKSLIDAKLIPKGEVDDRDIEDVKPSDLKGFVQCHFFAGIAGWARALDLAGWDVTRPVWTASLPCQPFSCAGKQQGEKDERHLWPIFYEKVERLRPQVIFGEQVSSKLGREWLGGKEKIMQSVRDRETIIRVLQICNAFRDLPPEMQRMLQGRGKRKKKQDTKRRKIKMVQGVSSKKQGKNSGKTGETSCKTERLRVLFGRAYRPPARCYRCGRLRTDGDTIQPNRGKNVGQPIARQSGLFERIYSGQCACGTLLRKRDGEPVGRKQDYRNSKRDNGNEKLSLRGITEQIRICFEAANKHRSIAGVRLDLEALGYEVGAADLPAASVGAPHKRQRLWWVANSKKFNRKISIQQREKGIKSRRSSGSYRVANTSRIGWRRWMHGYSESEKRKAVPKNKIERPGNDGFWSNSKFIQCEDGKQRRVPLEPTLFPLAPRIPQRVGLLRGAGNSIVPQVAAEFIKAFMGY